MMDETTMGGGRKWLVVGLREREREKGNFKNKKIKKRFLFLAFGLRKML